jgi:hypothetical protein
VLHWGQRYGQRGWLRQLSGPVSQEMEDAALRTVARLDGTPFPSSVRLAGRWLRGRAPRLRLPWHRPDRTGPDIDPPDRTPDAPDDGTDGSTDGSTDALETAYCAEVVAVTYQEMGLLADDRRPSWYDPGRFWSGDELELAAGFALGGEVEVALPSTPAPRTSRARR